VLVALVSPPVLAEEGPTAEVELKATVVPPPFCVHTLPACNVGYLEATLWGAVVAWPPLRGVTVSFGWDTISHEDNPAAYAHWTPGNMFLLLFNASLRNLTPGTTYYFRAKGQKGGYTAYGEEMKFTTPPEFRVITLPATDIKPRQATLNGMTMGRSRSPKAKVSFGWDTVSHDGNPNGYAHWTSAKSIYAGDNFNYILTNLTPETTYYFRARTERGGTIYGDELSFTTPLEIRAITLPATSIKAKEATLNGTTIGDFRSPKAKVSFGWDTVSHAGTPAGYRKWTSATSVYAGNPFSYKLTKLTPNTTYYFRARAERNGTVSYGEELRFTTPP
jgi:hypothetical protein